MGCLHGKARQTGWRKGGEGEVEASGVGGRLAVRLFARRADVELPFVQPVVEAAGTEESFNAASALIKHNGKFVFYSWVTTPIKLNISRPI